MPLFPFPSCTVDSALVSTGHLSCGYGFPNQQFPVTAGLDLFPMCELASCGHCFKGTSISNFRLAQVTYTSDTWVGIGFPSTSALSMTGSGAGTDTFICSSGAVKRYWLLSVTVGLWLRLRMPRSHFGRQFWSHRNLLLVGLKGETWLKETGSQPG